MKKIISVLLSLIMILGSVNLVLAADASLTPYSTFLAQSTKNTLVANTLQTKKDERSFVVFDLKEYIPSLYLGDSAELAIKSGQSSAYMNNIFEISIVPQENKELIKKAAADIKNVTSAEVKQMAAFQPDTVLYKEKMGWGKTHAIKNVENAIKNSIESCKDTSVAFMISSNSDGYSSFTTANTNLTISNSADVRDDDYYDLITGEFDFDNEVNVSSDAIAEDFTLPSFYKGSNITWSSDNEAITITGNNAAVIQQIEDTKVELTATFSYKEGSSFAKDYNVTVSKKNILDVIAAEFDKSYSLTTEPLNAVTKDVNLASSYMGASLTWTSSNINVVHPVTGKVVLPLDADASVSLTPTISSDGDSRELNPINITVKKYNGKLETIVADKSASVYYNNGDKGAQGDEVLYSKSGVYTAAKVLWGRYVSYIMFDIRDVKDTIENSQGSMHINLTGGTYFSTEARSDNECYNLYIVDNNDWDNTLTYTDAKNKGMVAYCDDASDNDPNAIYCSPKGQIGRNQRYTTTDILPAVKAYLADNPDAQKISFMIYTTNNDSTVKIHGTDSSYQPSLEIRYNFETPSFEAVKNTDSTYSAVIKTNDAIDGSYNVYFAAYSSDNALVGVDVIPNVSIKSGATRINADAQKFVTQGATKIKCIITKADGITPLWKNDELELD